MTSVTDRDQRVTRVSLVELPRHVIRRPGGQRIAFRDTAMRFAQLEFRAALESGTVRRVDPALIEVGLDVYNGVSEVSVDDHPEISDVRPVLRASRLYGPEQRFPGYAASDEAREARAKVEEARTPRVIDDPVERGRELRYLWEDLFGPLATELAAPLRGPVARAAMNVDKGSFAASFGSAVKQASLSMPLSDGVDVLEIAEALQEGFGDPLDRVRMERQGEIVVISRMGCCKVDQSDDPARNNKCPTCPEVEMNVRRVLQGAEAPGPAPSLSAVSSSSTFAGGAP